MTDNRDQSFDPNRDDGARSFNGTQWFGVLLVVLGALAILVSLLGRLGVMPKFLDDPVPFIALVPVGAALLNARRRTAPCDPEALRRRRVIAITLAIAAAVLGAVLAILLAKGG